jgi:hypothetical protein
VNEHPLLDAPGFPSIQFVAAGSREPVVHTGGREFADLVAFVKTHAAVPIQGVEV